MSSSPITIDSVKTAALVGPVLSGVVTLIRLGERIHTRRFGWDDGWAAFSLSVFILFMGALYTHLGDPTHLTFATRVSLYYILAQTFYGVIWAARMSILFSVIRICPPSPLKKILWGLAGSFVFVWIILFAQVFWVCEAEPGWKIPAIPQCALGENVAIAQLISDIYADSMLIAAPLRLLWNLKTSASQRNRLIFVFASSIITTIASLIHAYYVLRIGGLDEVFVAIIEMCISLTICNLAVVVSIIARTLNIKNFGGGGKGQAGSSFQMSRSNRSNPQYTFNGGQASRVDPNQSTINIKSIPGIHHPDDSFLEDAQWPQKKEHEFGHGGIQVTTAKVVLHSPPDDYSYQV